MKDEIWNLNLIHQMVFPMALNIVFEMFEETDEYSLARRSVEAGLFEEKDVEALLQRFFDTPAEGKMHIKGEEILLLYTCLDIAGKLMISHKGDKILEMLSSDPHPHVKQGFDGVLQGASAMVRSMRKEYEGIPEFKERMEELDRLNEFI
jgi:hypothetical protein